MHQIITLGAVLLPLMLPADRRIDPRTDLPFQGSYSQARRTEDDGGAEGPAGEEDLFFENRGDGTFVESAARGLADEARAYGFGVVAADVHDDGWIDLYVANDTNPNFLHRNRGGGRFESAGLASGAALNAEGRAQAGMGVDAGDYDG